MPDVQALKTAGPYELAECLGFNGVVATYKGTHRDVGQPACVVVMAEDSLSYKDLWGRFEHEFSAFLSGRATRLCRPTHHGHDKGLYWATYEWMKGHHLGLDVRDYGLPSPGRAFEVGSQVLEALGVMHEKGIPHRYLTPVSIFLNDLGQVKLLHAAWGGLLLGVHDGPANPAFISSLPFLSPEVAFGGDGELSSDIYSLGAILYFLLTGAPVHWSSDPNDLLQIMQTTPVDLGPLNDVLPPDGVLLLEDLLQPDPADRPLNLEALSERMTFLANLLFERETHSRADVAIGQEEIGKSSRGFADLGDPGFPDFGDDEPTVIQSQQQEPPSPARAPKAATAPPVPPAAPVPTAPPQQPAPAWNGPPPTPAAQPTPAAAPAPQGPVPQQAPAAPPAPPRPQAATASPNARGGKPAKAKGKFDKGRLAILIGGAVFVLLLLLGGLVGLMALFSGGASEETDTAGTSSGTASGQTAGGRTAGGQAAAGDNPLLDPTVDKAELEHLRRYVESVELMERLSEYSFQYAQKYGVWAATPDELKDLGAEKVEDGWGTRLDLRDDFVVSAGPDRRWDTKDDLWFDGTALMVDGWRPPQLPSVVPEVAELEARLDRQLERLREKRRALNN
ncbi:MAG: hypothetical protein RLY93_08950 [Sumerlaeia bacterium]